MQGVDGSVFQEMGDDRQTGLTLVYIISMLRGGHDGMHGSLFHEIFPTCSLCLVEHTGDLQPDCSADRPVTGPRQPT
eukprot:1160055-Pelagomonas_calceolata.AAC.8